MALLLHILVLLFAFLLLVQTLGQPLEQPYNITDINEDAVGHHHSISVKSPVTLVLRNDENLRRRVDQAYPFFDEIWSIIAERRRKNDSFSCNLRQDNWVNQGIENVRINQVGHYDEGCYSRLDISDAEVADKLPRGFVSSARNTIVDIKDALYDAMIRIDEIPNSGNEDLNWTRGPHKLQWSISRVGQHCTVNNLFAYRVDSQWYFLAGVSNNPVDAYMPEWRLSTIYEFVRQDLQHSLKLPWVRFGTDDVIEEGTTFLNRGSGKLSLAATADMDFDDNPALDEALRLNAIAVDQAQDAITPSNIAILALPMVMSLVPVAFIADLNTFAMLLYIIFTDVFAALPFLIKGVELLDSTSAKRDVVVAYHMGNGTVGQLESWAAQCRGQDNFRILGIAFICIAVVAILLGIVLELIAGCIMNRRRSEKGQDAIGPFGMALFDSSSYSLFGNVFQSRDDNRLSNKENEFRTWASASHDEDVFNRDRGVTVEEYNAGESFSGAGAVPPEQRRGKRNWWLHQWMQRKGGERRHSQPEEVDIAAEEEQVLAIDIQSPDVSYDTGMRQGNFGFDIDGDLGP